MAEGKQWARLTAERKFRIFLETRGTERVCRELREKERALAELSVEYTLLKKSERSGSMSDEAGRPSRRKRGRLS